MGLGPVQLVVLGFRRADLAAGVLAEVERVRAVDGVSVLDALVLHKDAEGALEAEDVGSFIKGTIAALIGLDIADGGESAVAVGPPVDGDGFDVFADAEPWDVIGEVPNDSTAALILLEHRWAVPLLDALVRAGGVRISDGFVSPLDLAELGLLPAREAQRMHAIETAGASGLR